MNDPDPEFLKNSEVFDNFYEALTEFLQKSFNMYPLKTIGKEYPHGKNYWH
jgi:hypothetical protein